MGEQRGETDEAERPAHLQPVVDAHVADDLDVDEATFEEVTDELADEITRNDVAVALATPGADDASDEVARLLDGCGLADHTWEELRRRVRQLADVRRYERAATADFTGITWDALAADLSAYALPVMMAWLRRGRIFAECKAKHREVSCPEYWGERLATHFDERQELAGDIVVGALALVVKLGRRGRGWSPDKKASLNTYFVGACVLVFPNLWRRWLKEQGSNRELLADAPHELVPPSCGGLDPFGGDPARIVASRDFVRATLDALSSSVRVVAEPYVLGGATHVEIAERLNITSAAVERRLGRERARQAKTSATENTVQSMGKRKGEPR